MQKFKISNPYIYLDTYWITVELFSIYVKIQRVLRDILWNIPHKILLKTIEIYEERM